jgi:putative ABC transport system permease protein
LRRSLTFLLSAFAFIAVMLAAIGLYGVMNYNVAQRTREIGLRVALGAQSSDVLRQVLRQGMTLVAIGIVIGILGAAAVTQLMKSLLFGTNANDPVTFIVVASVLWAVALMACYIPARRATKVDPMVALRYE